MVPMKNYHSNQSAVEFVCHSVFSQMSTSLVFRLVVSQTRRRCPFVSRLLGFIVLCLRVEKELQRKSSCCSIGEPFKDTGVHDM